MPRNKIFDVQNSPFSSWHRSQHDGISYVDLDVLGICPACAKILFIADTIYNTDGKYRGKSKWLRSPYRQIASSLEVPYFEIFYTVDENTENREITEFAIRRLYPTLKDIKTLSTDEMLKYLEYKAIVEHGPDCASIDYLKKRINENKSKHPFARKYMYEQILSQ